MTDLSRSYANNTRLITPWFAIAALLMVPFIAMQLTGEVRWSVGDFLVMGGMMAAVVATYQLVTIKVRTAPRRIMVALSLFILFMLVWAQLAVGLLDIPGFTGS